MVALNNNLGLDGYLIINCRICDNVHTVYVNTRDYKDWADGKGLIQDIFDYLSSNERELLLSNICGKCFDEMIETQDDF